MRPPVSAAPERGANGEDDPRSLLAALRRDAWLVAEAALLTPALAVLFALWHGGVPAGRTGVAGLVVGLLLGLVLVGWRESVSRLATLRSRPDARPPNRAPNPGRAQTAVRRAASRHAREPELR